MEVSQIRGTILGVPIVRTIIFWGLYGVPLFWETTTFELGSCVRQKRCSGSQYACQTLCQIASFGVTLHTRDEESTVDVLTYCTILLRLVQFFPITIIAMTTIGAMITIIVVARHLKPEAPSASVTRVQAGVLPTPNPKPYLSGLLLKNFN